MYSYHIISGDLWAGAEVMAAHLLKGLHQSGSNVVVILLNYGRLEKELRSAGVEVEVIDERQISLTQLISKIRKIIAQSGNFPCVVHTHRYKENLIGRIATLGVRGCRLVTTQHGLPESHDQKVPLRSRVITWGNYFLLKYTFNKVVSVSADIKNHFVVAHTFPVGQVEVIRNGIDIVKQVSKARVDTSCLNIGSSGRLFPVKDYPLMVEIAACLSRDKGISFFLAGEGPERERLEEMVGKKRLITSFTLEGHQDDMDPFYRKLDLYVNTSVHEGIPMTILEAMSYGLPVVAPRVGGIPEVVDDGVNGFLISGRNPLDFAEKIRNLAADPQLYARMSAAARKKAEESFSVERMTAQYLLLYEEVLRQ